MDALGDGSFPIPTSGAAKVGTIVLLGTPNLGSVRAAKHDPRQGGVGLSQVSPEVLATMPSVYELLPAPAHRPGRPSPSWWGSRSRSVRRRNLKRFQWSVFSPSALEQIRSRYQVVLKLMPTSRPCRPTLFRTLERARRFIWSLTFRPASPVKFVVFGGDCVLTPALSSSNQGRASLRRGCFLTK